MRTRTRLSQFMNHELLRSETLRINFAIAK